MEDDVKYCGIDLHGNNSVVVISDEADHVLYSRRHPNGLNAILGALAPYRAELSGVVVESTYNWYWLVDGLLEAGYRVHLANTAASMKDSSIGATNPMRATSRTCCDWGCCPKATSCPRTNVRSAIWRESACSWYSAARRKY